MRMVTLDDPDFAGTYTVEPHSDGTLILEPVDDDVGPFAATLLRRAGARALTPEEFSERFGDLPTDDEG
ncbi:MAG TPA: hypothetical protein VG455_04265 [Acidimicrobiales bacterium]|nr:hypothetical protein [Acidimicrobiales bacterium]